VINSNSIRSKVRERERRKRTDWLQLKLIAFLIQLDLVARASRVYTLKQQRTNKLFETTHTYTQKIAKIKTKIKGF